MTEWENWALEWKERIGSLYHLKGLRLDEWQPDRPLAHQSAAFQAHPQALARTLEGLEAEAAQLTAPEPKRLMPPEATALSRGARQKQRTIAQSLLEHWDG